MYELTLLVSMNGLHISIQSVGFLLHFTALYFPINMFRYLISSINATVPENSLLLVLNSPWFGFSPEVVHVGFMVDKVALGHAFL